MCMWRLEVNHICLYLNLEFTNRLAWLNSAKHFGRAKIMEKEHKEESVCESGNETLGTRDSYKRWCSSEKTHHWMTDEDMICPRRG